MGLALNHLYAYSQWRLTVFKTYFLRILDSLSYCILQKRLLTTN